MSEDAKIVYLPSTNLGDKDSKPPLKNDDGDGTSSDMETRVRLLEYRADQTEKLLTRMDGKLDGLIKDVSEIKGKVGTLPTTWNIIGIFAAMMGLLLGGGGIVLAILRFMTPA